MLHGGQTVHKEKPTDEFYGLIYDHGFRIPNTVSYGRLYREVVRRMVGTHPPSLQNLFEQLALRLKSTGG